MPSTGFAMPSRSRRRPVPHERHREPHIKRAKFPSTIVANSTLLTTVRGDSLVHSRAATSPIVVPRLRDATFNGEPHEWQGSGNHFESTTRNQRDFSEIVSVSYTRYQRMIRQGSSFHLWRRKMMGEGVMSLCAHHDALGRDWGWCEARRSVEVQRLHGGGARRRYIQCDVRCGETILVPARREDCEEQFAR